MNTLEYQTHVLNTISRLKSAPAGVEALLPVVQDGRTVANLKPVGWHDLDSTTAIQLLAEWREAASSAFPAIFPVTLAGTKRWLQKQLLETPDRLLFWLVTPSREPIGHVGLFRFNAVRRHIEIDNIVRGRPGVLPGVMHAAVSALLEWTFRELRMCEVLLRVFLDNERAIRLYEHCGFEEIERMPMRKEAEGEVTRWLEVDAAYAGPIDRHFVTMRLPEAEWRSRREMRRAA